MSFVSYAQNFEDVMLWRALKHIEVGFYIDVGGYDPTSCSVTRAFYERGWNGINLEPVPELFEKFVEQRQRDINLQLGAGAKPGRLPFYEIAGTGLSTTNTDIEELQRNAGWSSRRTEIDVVPLSQICSDHVKGEIHFLKVDVEGAEIDVLAGMDFVAYRPWIVLAENTGFDQWEPLLLNSGYRFVYFDGLNRFYIAEEHGELADSFKVPPNVFDDFVTYALVEAQARATKAEGTAGKFASLRNRISRKPSLD